MNSESKNEWFNSKNAIVLILGALVMYLVSTSLVESRFRDIENSTRAHIAEQESLMIAIAEASSRNGADTVIELNVRDCSIFERSSLDNLLDQLNNGLNNTKLVELERLFGRCGSFFSDRKSMISSRLNREIEVYDDYVDQLSLILGEDSIDSEFKVNEWSEFAEIETKTSALFAELVVIQDTIITSLLDGKSPNSDEILTISQDAVEISETISVTTQQAAKIRTELLSF
jgi:hypothetical protein